MSRPVTRDDPFLSGPWRPWPMEGEIHDLAVVGEIPAELSGTLYRNGPNPQFDPRGDYHVFTGDGMIHAFQLEDGRAHYRNRWVRTPRFDLEREAGEALYASFDPRNDDPRTRGIPGGPANTNVVCHAGRLLALVEGGLPPVELDPDTLETRGIWDFHGTFYRPMAPEVARALGVEAPDGRAPGVFTAHPKLDPESGQMLGFGYDLMAPYMIYYEVSADGRIQRSEEIDIGIPAMVHDFVTTRDHVVFPIFPATLRLERMREGRSVFAWEPGLGNRIGVMPRNGGAADMVWFEGDPSFAFHPLNAHTEGRRVIAELAQYPTLPIPADGNDLGRGPVEARLVRWTLDLDGGGLKEEPLDDRSIEFPRLDERFAGLDYRYGFAAGEGDVLRGMRSILRYDVRSGECRAHRCGAADCVSEPIFVPRRADSPEGEGFLLSVVHRGEEQRSDLLILDAEQPEAEALATVQLPHAVPLGFHGNWRPAT